jgi:RNA polymerase sigma factor (TIGR02999 family)
MGEPSPGYEQDLGHEQRRREGERNVAERTHALTVLGRLVGSPVLTDNERMSSAPTGPSEPAGDVTHLLRRASEGDGGAARELYESIYGELHRLARAHMNGDVPGQTLQPTALVNEAWLRLAKAASAENGYRDREHFLSVASRAMRSALVDQARRRTAEKRGGDRARVPLEVAIELYEERGVDLLALDDALERLATDEPRQSQVVELRFFGGLTLPEVASTIGISRATVDRDWSLARIWLREELRAEAG